MGYAQRTPEREELLERIRSLGPLIEEHIPEAERSRKLPQPVFDALVEAGLFRLSLPRGFGGFEADPMTQFEIYEEASRLHGSTGWSLMIGALQNGLAAARLGDDALARIFDRPDAVIAGLLPPRGAMLAQDGGYLVNGRYAFASGSDHATWITACSAVMEEGKPVMRPDGLPKAIIVWAPMDQATIHDNWYAMGLKATASCDYSIENVHVPEAMTSQLFDGAPARPGALYRIPTQAFLQAGHSGVPLGLARRALDEISKRAKTKPASPMGPSPSLAETSAFQFAYARAESRLRAARAYALEAFELLWEIANSGAEVSARESQNAKLASVNANETSLEVIEMAFRYGGGSAVYEGGVLERCLRDAQTLAQHIAYGQSVYETAAQVMLGLIERPPIL